jgi:hypothetical protein
MNEPATAESVGDYGVRMLEELGATTRAQINRLGDEIDRLRRDNACMTAALEEIEERAQDNYDGPEDRTHGPYLSMARYGLGRTP